MALPIKCSCGTWNSENSRFCRNCGSKLPERETKTDKPVTKPVREKTGGSSISEKDIFQILGVITIIAALVMFFCDGISKLLATSLVAGGIGLCKAGN